MKIKILFIILSLLAVVFMFSCSDKDKLEFDSDKTIEGAGEWKDYKEEINTATNTDTTNEESEIADETNNEDSIDVINFGITPWDTEENLRKWWTPILDYLSEQLNVPVLFNLPPDYGTLQKDLAENNIQLASFSPGAFADAIISLGDKIKYIATLEVDESYFYQGYIFTLKTSPINNLADAKGKTMGFTDTGSSSGFKYPVTLLLNKSIVPEKYFSDIFFLGNHDNVLQGVYDGNVDVGATWNGKYNSFNKEHGEPFKIIIKTKEIPFDGFAASQGVSDDLLLRIQTILGEIDGNTKLQDGSPVLIGDEDYNITGFVIRDITFYDVVIDTAKKVNEYLKSTEF